jgi:hypothetical protein
VKSFEQFYQEFRGRFFAYLLRLTREPDLAGEIMQESFTRYLESCGDRRFKDETVELLWQEKQLRTPPPDRVPEVVFPAKRRNGGAPGGASSFWPVALRRRCWPF